MARWQARHFTNLKRLAGCGAWLNGSADGQVLIRLNDGVAHYSGLQTCGSVWSCPSCAAKIRQSRADELETAIESWLANGGGIEFVTLTVPHGLGDDLGQLFDLVADGWRKGLLSGRWAKGIRRSWKIPAWVRTIEVTYGKHGWHPHIHALLFTKTPWDGRQRAARGRRLFDKWADFVRKTRGVECSADAFRIVGGGAGAGAYIAKLQEGSRWSLGVEFMRGDLKTARGSSVTPFEFIAPAHDGEAWALHRWWEWEEVTRGRRCMSWSVGARKVLGLVEDEQTDDELAAEEIGGTIVCGLTGEAWARVRRTPGTDAALLDAAERSGALGVGRFLADLDEPPG